MVTINSTIAASLFGSSSSSSSVTADLLVQWVTAKAGISSTTTAAAAAQGGADPNAPIEPVWTPGVTPDDATLVARAISGKAFFDTNAQLYSDLQATGDYKKLFALSTGISTLQALANNMSDTTLTASAKASIQAQFTRGLTEMQSFFGTQQFSDVRLAEGDRVDSSQTTLAIPSTSEDYTTGVLATSLTGALSQLDPNAKFNITATSSTGNVRSVSVDLSQMGSIPRSLSNIVSFINGKLSAAGAQSRLAAVDVSPKTQLVVVGGQVVNQPYTGAKQYALQVDVRGGEKVAFNPIAADPAFYVVGQVSNGARLIKLTDTDGNVGLPDMLSRPDATSNPTGPNVATGWYGPGDPYSGPPANSSETDTNAIVSSGTTNFETKLNAAGEATLKLTTADGRQISVTTAWKSKDLEAWRVHSGEDADRGKLDDLAERFTQLLHEQGVAAGVDVWDDGNGNSGLAIYTGEGVQASGVTISGLAATLTPGATEPGDVGGLRDGIYARQYQSSDVGATTTLFKKDNTVTIQTASQSYILTVNGGTGGIDSQTFLDRLNKQLHDKGVPASAAFANNGGQLQLQINGMHDLIGFTTTLNGTSFSSTLQAPPAGVLGGLPDASIGQPYGDSLRETVASGSPLIDNPGALNVQVVVSTPTGDKTVSVAVSATERTNDPDPSPGSWSSTFQDRLNTALNAAGFYVGSVGDDLTHWLTAEASGQRISSISVNGAQLTLSNTAPTSGIGGAFSVERSFTSAQAATGVSDNIAALQSNPNVSLTISTAWGDKTITASLQPGDPPTLQSAAQRLNEALSAAGYDAGVVATDLSGGGAGLRIVTGSSHTVRGVGTLSLGGASVATTLDPIDSSSHADDPNGIASVATRATRGAAVTQTIPKSSATLPPSGAAAGWFPGRAFDVAVGANMAVATARAVATASDGSIYVLADLGGDSATTPIKGARDVALLKYNSAGQLDFSRILGASDSASGYALAVSSDGNVAVAGSVTGALTGANGAVKGGADSFVALYDSKGNQLWDQRRAATADDQVNAVAFASDGSVIVAGKTNSSLGPVLAAGGADGYVRGFSKTGGELFVKQFGTGGDDSATALLVRDDGNGGTQIVTGGVENNRGVLRSFTYSAQTGFTTGATRDIGYFYGGGINALASDGLSLYVGGATGADRLTLGTPAQASVAGQDGFVARLNVNLTSTDLDRASYIGSAQDDAVTGLVVSNHVVYASGVDGGVIAGQGSSNTKTGFLAKLDDAGQISWARSFSSAGGTITANGLAVDATGSSPLDALGLPRGVVNAQDSSALVSRSALKVGDQFQVGTDPKRLTTITIKATDTIQTLQTAINRAIGGDGRAEIVTDDKGNQSIKITPNDGKALTVAGGPDGNDALPGLGLKPGIIAVNTTKRGSMKTFGLGLVAADLKLDSTTALAKTKAELSAAQSIIRQAYDALLHPNAQPLTAEQQALQDKLASAGAAPAYLTAQLQNYQAALLRLTGSSS